MHRVISTVGAAALALGMAGSAQAALLSDLLAGGSITTGNTVFDQFRLIHEDYSEASLTVNPTQIDVTPLTDGGSDPGPGLRYDVVDPNTLTVTGDSLYAYLNYMFGFRVSDMGGAATLKDNTLHLLSATNSSPALDLGSSIEEFVGNDPTLVETPGAVNLPDLGVKQVELSEVVGVSATDVASARADFDPQPEIFVSTNILVWATDPAETAALYQFEQRFSLVSSETPAPGALALLGGGLLALFFARRRC